ISKGFLGFGRQVRQENIPVGLPMVEVPAGAFWMGAKDDDEDTVECEKPRHKVQLSGYQISQTPVTQRQYTAVIGENPSGNPASAQHPVENVSWFDAVRFCNALSQRCGLEEAYTIGGGDKPRVSCRFDAHGFRLPTEAEWEYAAKAGQDFKYSGSDAPDEVAWYDGNSGGKTHPVALKKPNAWGLYDMSGNVWEWCWDWYDKDEYQNRVSLSGDKMTIANQPKGPKNGVRRVLRGGSYVSAPWLLRTSSRYWLGPDGRSGVDGFRLTLPSPSQS
ncbi:MAG: formylglycine-generating enzyme family protein, partial [Myxococcota bacterium]|nr:formylglycine-generating enzyme family protein [Myxococcota bacterium]